MRRGRWQFSVSLHLCLSSITRGQFPQVEQTIRWGKYKVTNWMLNYCDEEDGWHQIREFGDCEDALFAYRMLCPNASLITRQGCLVGKQTWGGPAGCIVRRSSVCFDGGRLSMDFNPNMNGVETLCNIAPVCYNPDAEDANESGTVICNVADDPSEEEHCNASPRQWTITHLCLAVSFVFGVLRDVCS
eukprot:TRINITY_DN10949_c0_g1_i1.p1 TRINITY_DN10949_c0_g1~~TRINITY_DN10949_c0_g1_i1.p1  ORF type:complete len:188 (+),score=12.44 TRINITY_DN10949_c0_g1_i1:148-711(+)